MYGLAGVKQMTKNKACMYAQKSVDYAQRASGAEAGIPCEFFHKLPATGKFAARRISFRPSAASHHWPSRRGVASPASGTADASVPSGASRRPRRLLADDAKGVAAGARRQALLPSSPRGFHPLY